MQKLTSRDLVRLRLQRSSRNGSDERCVTICSGTGCLAGKSAECAAAMEQELDKRGLRGEIELRRTGCYGLCERGPVVVVEPENICYLDVRPKDVPKIVEKTLLKHEPIERLLYRDSDGRRIRKLAEIPFYRHQTRVLLHANVLIDPTSIDDYIGIGGYQALAKVLSGMTPEEVVNVIKESGLRGRGGGGFPTGVKWETTRNAPGEPKYVVVNADEGDPGAYMDRSLLEGNPHSILEGLIIGAYAIGAHQGYIYVRQEYPLAVQNTRLALEKARERGLLGKDILGSHFSFDVAVHEGAGAFVSGESSALMNAIEGRVGEPRPKYVHTSVQGLWGKPTNLNNVETWANVPLIIDRGAAWFHAMGTKNSKGTKVFSLTGKVNNTGLVEVPMGMTLRELVNNVGGGVRDGKKLKAVQTGGPSGGFIPESMLDVKVDFDELWEAGSMMGSGGMIVMDEDTCMVDATRFYVRFLAHESCGQCVPCREGLRQMVKILDRIASGDGVEGDLETARGAVRPAGRHLALRAGHERSEPGAAARSSTSAPSSRRTSGRSGARRSPAATCFTTRSTRRSARGASSASASAPRRPSPARRSPRTASIIPSVRSAATVSRSARRASVPSAGPPGHRPRGRLSPPRPCSPRSEGAHHERRHARNRWQRGNGPRGDDAARGGPQGRGRHPDAVRLSRAQAGRHLPHVHGRDHEGHAQEARGVLRVPGRGRSRRRDRERAHHQAPQAPHRAVVAGVGPGG